MIDDRAARRKTGSPVRGSRPYAVAMGSWPALRLLEMAPGHFVAEHDPA